MQKYLSLFEKILFWGVMGLLVFVPLYPKFPIFNIKGTFAAIRVEDFLITAVIAIWIFCLFLSGKLKQQFSDRLNQTLLLFFFVGALSLYSAVVITHTATFTLGGLNFLRRVEFMLFLPIGIFVIRTKKQLSITILVIFVTTFLVNVYGLGQQYLHWPVISTTNSEFAKGMILYLTEGARVNSTFAGYYDLAVYLVMVLAIISAIFFSFKNYVVKLLTLFLSAISFFVLILTAARLSFVAAIAGIIVSFVLVGKKMFVFLIIALALAAMLYPSPLRDRLVSTIKINLLGGGDRYVSEQPKHQTLSDINIPSLYVQTASPTAVPTKKNVKDPTATGSSTIPSDIAPGEPTNLTQLGVYRSYEIRLNQEWPRAIRGFIKNPLLGTGYSSLGLATDNDFLRSLGETGFLGTLSFILVLVVVTKRLWKNIKASDKFLKYFSAGVLSMVLAFILNGMFIDVFEASKIAFLFWLIAGFGIAVEKLK